MYCRCHTGMHIVLMPSHFPCRAGSSFWFGMCLVCLSTWNDSLFQIPPAYLENTPYMYIKSASLRHKPNKLPPRHTARRRGSLSAFTIYLLYYIPTVDIGFIGHVSYCHRHYTHNGRRLYRPYPLERNGGDAHERYERFFITSYRIGNSFTKEITALVSQPRRLLL